MIKAIIFDFGNVICKFDNNIFIKNTSKYTNKSIKELNDLIYNKSNLTILYETGIISSDEFFEELVKLCDMDISKELFRQFYTDIFYPISSTFEMIKKLKNNYKLALLSNTSEWDFEFGIKKFEIINFFDTIMLSYEVRAMKPDNRIFEDCLNKLRLKPEECIYIDDVKEYSDKANELGMIGINYKSENDLINKFEKFNIKLN